jgi:hypothetical protein
MTMPTSNEISTCQLVRPSAKRLPAVTYPPTLCTSDIQKAKMLYDVQLCWASGARSSLVSRGSYVSLMTAIPAGWSSASTNSVRDTTLSVIFTPGDVRKGSEK